MKKTDAGMTNEKKTLWIIGSVFFLIGFLTIILLGSTYTLAREDVILSGSADDYTVTIDQDHEVIRLTGKRLKEGVLYLDMRSVSRGRAFISVYGPEDAVFMDSVYVHGLGIITVGNYLGKTRGAVIIPILVTLYLAILLCYAVKRYRKGMSESMYQYINIRNLGWIIFLALMILGQFTYLFSERSLVGTIRSTLSSASSASAIIFPIAFITSILVAISNIQLIRKEGRNWRNMLGLILGLLVCLGTLVPHLLSEFLQRTTIVDVHNERGIAMHIEMLVTNSILICVSYLECILLATVLLALKAARNVPAFDKDYIMILGCQIRKDGSLTPLLKGRADRAIEFARMQKEKTGKEIIFVPTGGKGDDEVMPEAEAIRNYLAAKGIPETQILVENASANTEENFRNSLELIEKRGSGKIAFSTTNYHVFRSGILAYQQGIKAEGIGSKTRSYFWINAFVREFIATIYAEWKKHAKVILLLLLLVLAMVSIVYFSNIMQ